MRKNAIINKEDKVFIEIVDFERTKWDYEDPLVSQLSPFRSVQNKIICIAIAS